VTPFSHIAIIMLETRLLWRHGNDVKNLIGFKIF